MTPGAMPSIAIGKVADNADPEGHGRVILTFPWLDASMRTDWVPVVQPHAGNDRGVYWMPEIDDEMVVGFLHGDMQKPVVLGAMWNPTALAPSRDPRQRMIRSKNGHTIRFVDSTPNGGDMGALIIQDGHGSSLTFSNSYVRLNAIGTLVIEASAVMIRGPGWTRTITPNSNPI